MDFNLVLDRGGAAWTVNILLLIVGFVLLVKGADFFVDGASGIAKKLRISSFIIGVTVVAIGTSAPELAVTVFDALGGAGDIIIGNILGSNVINIFLILGISALICRLPSEKSTRFIDMPFLIFVSVLFLVFGAFVGGYDAGNVGGKFYFKGVMPWYCGLILLVLYFAFMAYNIVLAKKQSKAQLEQATATSVADPVAGVPAEGFIPRVKAGYRNLLNKVWFLVLMVFVGLIMVVGGATLVVNSARTVAVELIGIPTEIVALTVVAFGTSLPELITSVSAAKKGDVGIATGNIIGSNIANILLIGGIGALCTGSRGLAFTMDGMLGGVMSLVAAVLIFGFSMGKTKSLGKIAGAVMLACLVGYYTFLFVNVGVGIYTP